MLWPIRITHSVAARIFRLLTAGSFRSFGKKSWVVKPNSVLGAHNIAIGHDVYVAPNAILAAQPHDPASACVLEIGDGSRIGHFNHIYATRKIVLGKNVLTANGVYIADNAHEYRNANVPILHQPVRQLPAVTIGDGTWLGHNVCVLGCSIGRNCVVGANSVVTRDIPDRCVAVGAPARIVRRYDGETSAWRATADDGTFLGAE